MLYPASDYLKAMHNCVQLTSHQVCAARNTQGWASSYLFKLKSCTSWNVLASTAVPWAKTADAFEGYFTHAEYRAISDRTAQRDLAVVLFIHCQHIGSRWWNPFLQNGAIDSPHSCIRADGNRPLGVYSQLIPSRRALSRTPIDLLRSATSWKRRAQQ